MGSYIDGTLGPQETVVASAKVTGWIWLWPVIATVLTMGWLCPILLFPLIRQMTTEMAVTNKRVIAKFGLIRRNTVEQRVQKVESIQVQQSVLGRILGYGTIIVHGTGGARTPIADVASPFDFKRAVEATIERSEAA